MKQSKSVGVWATIPGLSRTSKFHKARIIVLGKAITPLGNGFRIYGLFRSACEVSKRRANTVVGSIEPSFDKTLSLIAIACQQRAIQ
jgi:hypothetical protein